MKLLKQLRLAVVITITVAGTTSCDITSLLTTTQYSNPSWGPSYTQGARYYYLPDIETYYDLSDQSFICLNNGQWIFSRSLPIMYSGYDLYNAFIITLNISVFQPWMHHQNYQSHYPRYYYRNTYRDHDFANIRGFNENDNKPVYWRPEDKNRINDQRKNEKQDNRPEINRQPQEPNYYGKSIGQPVKVKSNMRENKKGNRKNEHPQ